MCNDCLLYKRCNILNTYRVSVNVSCVYNHVTSEYIVKALYIYMGRRRGKLSRKTIQTFLIFNKILYQSVEM